VITVTICCYWSYWATYSTKTFYSIREDFRIGFCWAT